MYLNLCLEAPSTDDEKRQKKRMGKGWRDFGRRKERMRGQFTGE